MRGVGVETEWRFQPPVGGAIAECQYAHMYAVRAESPSSLWRLVKIGQCMQKFWVTLRLVASTLKSSNFEALPQPHPLRFEKALQDFFYPPWLKSNLAKFEACNMKCIGGVRSYARCGNGQKWRQNACSTQNCRLPVDLALWCPYAFRQGTVKWLHSFGVIPML